MVQSISRQGEMARRSDALPACAQGIDLRTHGRSGRRGYDIVA